MTEDPSSLVTEGSPVLRIRNRLTFFKWAQAIAPVGGIRGSVFSATDYDRGPDSAGWLVAFVQPVRASDENEDRKRKLEFRFRPVAGDGIEVERLEVIDESGAVERVFEGQHLVALHEEALEA